MPLSGDDIGRLYRREAAALLTFFSRRVFDPEMAVDLVGETFAAAFHDRRQFRGRIALRTLPGRTVIYGLARPDVREITIESPRDVRTIVPSARAHAFIVVYDGSFATGETVFRITFKNGTHATQLFGPLAF